MASGQEYVPKIRETGPAIFCPVAPGLPTLRHPEAVHQVYNIPGSVSEANEVQAFILALATAPCSSRPNSTPEPASRNRRSITWLTWPTAPGVTQTRSTILHCRDQGIPPAFRVDETRLALVSSVRLSSAARTATGEDRPALIRKPFGHRPTGKEAFT